MKRSEQFSDKLRRLFPEESKDCTMCVGGNFIRNITFQVTDDCILRCTYCYEHAKTHTKMSFETAKKFVDMILASDERTSNYIRSRECPGAVFDFIGGEPFLEIDLISDICDYIIEQMILLDHPWLNRYRFSFSSNGTLYFNEKVQKYLKKHLAHVSLTITIDGTKEMHDKCRVFEDGSGSYDIAYAAAQDWKKLSGQEQGIKITISPDNLDLFDSAILEFIKQGAKNIFANCVFEKGWTIEHAKVFYWKLKALADYLLDNDLQDDYFVSLFDRYAGNKYPDDKPWCGGNGLMMCVDPRGDIYPCVRYTPISVGDAPKYILGNVDKGFFATDKIAALSKITRSSQVKGTKCETCPISQGCADCAGYSYEIYGDVGARTDFICDMHKATVLAQVYYRNLAFQKAGKKMPLAMNCPKDWAVEIIGEEEFQRLEMIASDSRIFRNQ